VGAVGDVESTQLLERLLAGALGNVGHVADDTARLVDLLGEPVVAPDSAGLRVLQSLVLLIVALVLLDEMVHSLESLLLLGSFFSAGNANGLLLGDACQITD